MDSEIEFFAANCGMFSDIAITLISRKGEETLQTSVFRSLHSCLPSRFHREHGGGSPPPPPSSFSYSSEPLFIPLPPNRRLLRRATNPPPPPGPTDSFCPPSPKPKPESSSSSSSSSSCPSLPSPFATASTPKTPSAAPFARSAASAALAASVIETFPTVVYSAMKGRKIGEASLECAVCLNDFEDDDTLRLIPKCDHAFHPDCIGAWLASHTTCPVCRADLGSQPAGDSESQQAESGTEPPLVEVTVEAAPPDGSAPERSPREGGGERIQPPDLWDKNERGSFNNSNGTRGSGRIRMFLHSHSTGHSLVRPGEDTERFTLRLPTDARKQLMDQPGPVLPQEGCSRQGYRCEGEGSSRESYFRRPDRLDWVAKSERWPFNRIPSFFVRGSPRMAADGGGRSSHCSVQQAQPAI